MFKGRSRFTDFLGAEEGIATNILADRLLRLEQQGIVERSAAPRGSTGRYRLTVRGIDLTPIMLEIIAWSARHDAATAADRRFVRRIRADRDGLVEEITSKLGGLHRKGKVVRAASSRAPQPLRSQPRLSQPGPSQPRSSQPRSSQPRSSQPRSSKPRSSQPRSSQPRSSKPRSSKPRRSQPRHARPQPRKGQP
ncbi:MAG: winged helix-turn-helix transcriptional regulator [Gemmatimonadota bacterium]